MSLIQDFHHLNLNYIIFNDPIKNTVVTNGIFTKLLYSTPNITFTNILLAVHLNDFRFEKHYNKYKCFFNVNKNKKIIEELGMMEKNILEKSKINKFPFFKIYENLRCGNFYFFSDNELHYSDEITMVLKISGIWENQHNCGINFKFIAFNKYL